ncbi:lectin-like protein [Pontiella sp.]|uniref:lectin-like protein n=1 Tax=Pontiella sp. TaxID=2837462 RepID=UPI0035648ACE
MLGLSISFAIDSDNDGISDLYETIFKLNSNDASDAAENNDEDGLSNLQESEAWTDPMTADTDADGFLDHEDDNPLSRAVVFWGYPDFTDGDSYRYTGPQWWLGAGKNGGEWLFSESGWRVDSGSSGSLYLDIDRSILAEDVVLELTHLDVSGCEVSLSLLDTNGVAVLDGVSVSPAGETGEYRLDRYAVPLAAYPTASRIQLTAQAGTEAYQVFTSILYIDADGDGLDADQEVQLGTSDENADSDGDGLSDRQEAVEFGSDPMNADADGDGLTDAQEIEFGSDPASADTDDDGLSDAEEAAHLYFLSDNPLTWPEAKAFAEASGGHLAVITSLDELNAAKSAYPVIKKARPWLGATDVEEEGVWKWITGEPFDYARWGEGEPNNYKQPEMYLRFMKNYYWSDASAESRTAVLIEYPNGLDPNSDDTDGDGLSDAREINELKTNAHASDSDGDGVSDANEVARGLNPLKVDTDGDGLEDGEELDMGLDASNPDTDGDGLEDNEELTHRYQVMTAHMTWPEAKVFAEQSGGHLAVFASQEEYYTALSACTNAKALKPWLGATDEAAEGVWEWVTGELFDYTRWATNEPNNYKQPEMYLRMGKNAKWCDMGSNTIACLMVEYEAGLNPLNPDSDGDGLSDGEELKLYGSSARSTDTDGDGISDDEEAALGINPANRDSDGDSIEDQVEIAMGLDPASVDTDGDGLGDSEEALQIYQLVDLSLTWEESSVAASNFGGHLAVITSDEETYAVSSLLPGVKQVHPWIGAYETSGGKWQWVNGEEFDYTHWDTDEPNDYKGPESYVQLISKSLKWNDAGESVTAAPLVEYAEGLDPLNPDSDEDGLLDGEELYTYGTSAHDADSDNDGVSDGDEIALGLDPLNADTDADGLTDGEERDAGYDPATPASDSDGLNDGQELLISLTDPLNADSDSDGLEDLQILQTINGSDFEGCYGPYWFSVWTNSGTSAELSSVCDGSPAVQYQVEIEEAGIYHLGMHVDLSGADTNELNKLPIDVADILVDVTIDGVDAGRAVQCFADELPEYSLFTPWLSEGTHTVKITFTKETFGISGPCVVETLEFGMVDGVDADGDGMADWMSDRLDSGMDSDGDGLTDAEELELGSDILDADTDGDGLDDGDELDVGTDLLDADSDGDGVSDGQEVYGSLTDPLAAEFDGTVTVVDALSGTEASGTLGEWTVEGSELKAESVRGHVEYVMNFPAGDMTRLVVKAAHEWNKSSCTPVIPIDESAFLVFVDDVYVGKFPMVSADGVYVEVNAFLPVLPAGEHTVRLYWENVHSRLAVKIQSLELQSLGGTDANGNGTKDWIEASIAAMAGVDAVTESYVSPACIEGDARYVEFMNVDGASSSVADAESTNAESNTTEQDAPSTLVRKGAGPRWYANLPLDQDDTTTATASFQNGALELPISIDWVAYNLMEHDGETLYVRAGDMVKFVALPQDANGGQFEIEYTLGMDGETVRSPNTRPLIYQFPSGGSYTVTGEYTHGNDTVAASITVVAIDGSFPEENPACLVGKERTWSFEGMTTNVTFEVDETVELTELNTTNLTLKTVALRATDTNGDHNLLARIPGGAILDSTKLDAFWIQNAVDGYFWIVETYEDSELWEVRSVAKNVPASVDIQIKVIVGGVTFDDYTLERWVTNGDYSDIGEYNFRLFHPNGEGSTCHTFRLYQDAEYIGKAYAAKQDDIGGH